MKKTNLFLKRNYFTYVLIALLLFTPLESSAIISASFDNAKADESIQTNSSPKKFKRKKKGKAKQKTMTKKFVAVPPGLWGAEGIILNVEEKGVNIQFACADGQIEQALNMDEQGDFSSNGFQSQHGPGPARVDANSARQPAIYKGKISGDSMTLKVTLTETKEVVGEFTLERGKTSRMKRCY